MCHNVYPAWRLALNLVGGDYMHPHRNRIFLTFCLASCYSCHDNHVEPASAQQEAAEQEIDVTAFGTDAKVTARVLNMRFTEAIDRLGSATFDYKSYFVFSRGGKDREQTDVGRAERDSTGNFHVSVDTGPNQLEVFRVDQKLYVRQDEGHLREKPEPDAGSNTWAEMAFSSMRQALEPFGPRLRFVDPKPESVAGRQAMRYRLQLGATGENAAALPAPPTAPVLPVPPPARWRELARPLDLHGELYIDSATGVPLRAKIEGRLEIPDREVRPTQLLLRYQGSLSKIGATGPIAVPKSVQEYVRKLPPADPLSFFRDKLPKPEEDGTAPE